MPLPPALAARLKKRGIIQDKEEVIAESYDSGDKEKNEEEENISGAPGCPNKYNPYHLCSEFCFDHWQDGFPESRLSDKYLRRKKRMLDKYPLPEGWTEVYDAGMARHYYWCPETDEVSWLSPRHPHAVIGESAPKIARELNKDRESYSAPSNDLYRDGDRDDRRRRDDDRRGYDRNRDKRREEKGKIDIEYEDDEGSDDDSRKEKKELSDRERLKRAKTKGIDPMDPAAYSDIAQGKWGSGLFEDDKSGVDTTAGGPLFQMRPYPTPGAIMRGKKKPDERMNE